MIERRQRRTDKLTLLLRVSAALGWVGILLIQFVAWKAAPEMDTVLVRYHELDRREFWQARWVNWMPFLLGFVTLLSLLALGVRPLRSRRRTDPKRWHLLVLLALTLAGYALYWFQMLNNMG